MICSEASYAARAECLVWILLYPDGEDRIEVGGAGVGGRAALPPGAKVADLLAVVDETELSLAPAREAKGSPAEG